MKTFAACFFSLLVVSSAAAQTAKDQPAPPQERASSGTLNLDLKLDSTTRRSVLTEQPSEQRSKGDSGVLPSLGAGNPARSFDPPTGSRPKSTGPGPYPKGVDAM